MTDLTKIYFADDRDNNSDDGEGAGNDQQVFVLI